MVRVNLINPKNLADQHLIAEYNEILMLLGYVRKFSEVKEIPNNYCLGKGHIIFFKNKLGYLKKRHEKIKKEMQRRGFQTNKSINLSEFHNSLVNHWSPSKQDLDIIKKRLREKLRKKPDYYRYCSEKKALSFFLALLKNSKNNQKI